MLEPANAPLRVWANARFPDDVNTLTDGNDPMDLTGKTLEMQVRLRPGAPDPALIDIDSDTASGDRIEVLSPATSGEFVIHIAEASLTALLDPLDSGEEETLFAYDLKVDGEVLAYGKFIVMAGVTR